MLKVSLLKSRLRGNVFRRFLKYLQAKFPKNEYQRHFLSFSQVHFQISRLKKIFFSEKVLKKNRVWKTKTFYLMVSVTISFVNLILCEMWTAFLQTYSFDVDIWWGGLEQCQQLFGWSMKKKENLRNLYFALYSVTFQMNYWNPKNRFSELSKF